MRRDTLIARLYSRIAPTILAAIFCVGALAFFSARHQINRSFDAQLRSNAGVLWMLVAQDVTEQNNDGERRFSLNQRPNPLQGSSRTGDYVNGRMFRIWRGGHLVMLSDNAPPKSTSPCATGFSNVRVGDDNWRVYALDVDNSVHIEVGEKIVLRRNFLNHIIADLTVPLIFLVPVTGVLLWLGIGNGLQTVRLLGRQLQCRSPEDLSPVVQARLPAELTPLVFSLNGLLEKLETSISAERRFADHVAHQLRTPLAGLKLQIQMLDMQERSDIVPGLLASVERAVNLVNKLLTAARVVHQPLQFKGVRLYEVVAGIIADMAAVITAKNLDVGLDGAEDSILQTDETLLAVLVTNIFENAVKFTPPGGSIAVVVEEQNDFPGSCGIFVQDSGPGIPKEKREFIFEKFSRLENEKVEGAGLGLSIVADIVERLRGRIEFGDSMSGQGLLLKIYLPGRP